MVGGGRPKADHVGFLGGGFPLVVDVPGQSDETPTGKCASVENVEAGKSVGHPAAIRPKSEKVPPGKEPRGGPPKLETQKS